MFKKIIKIIGAVLTVIACTFFLVFLRRHSDGQPSSGIDERDSRIKEGLGECSERTDRIEEGIGDCSERLEGVGERMSRAEDTSRRCEEHLRRAEQILQEAINKSKSK